METERHGSKDYFKAVSINFIAQCQYVLDLSLRICKLTNYTFSKMIFSSVEYWWDAPLSSNTRLLTAIVIIFDVFFAIFFLNFSRVINTKFWISRTRIHFVVIPGLS